MLLLALRLASTCRVFASSVNGTRCGFDASNGIYSCHTTYYYGTFSAYRKYASTADFVNEVRPIGRILWQTETSGSRIRTNTFGADQRLLSSVETDRDGEIITDTYTAWDEFHRVTLGTRDLGGTRDCKGVQLDWSYGWSENGLSEVAYSRFRGGGVGSDCGTRLSGDEFRDEYDRHGNIVERFSYLIPPSKPYWSTYTNEALQFVCY